MDILNATRHEEEQPNTQKYCVCEVCEAKMTCQYECNYFQNFVEKEELKDRKRNFFNFLKTSRLCK